MMLQVPEEKKEEPSVNDFGGSIFLILRYHHNQWTYQKKITCSVFSESSVYWVES